MTARQKLTSIAGGLAVGCAIALFATAAAVVVEAAAASAREARAAPAAERGISQPAGCCRWELAAVTAHGEASDEAPRGPVTMLMDQCTGRTWLLRSGPRGEFEWAELDRPVRPWIYGPG